MDFGGERTEVGISSWVLKKMGPAVLYKEHPDDLDTEVKKASVAVAFFGASGSIQFQQYEAACKNLDEITCYHLDDAES